ncbi:MAG: DUF5615 family PIN-like protein [Candidatus Sumerlaeia bacterium]
MKILADENFRRDLVDWLRNAGHDVAWIVEDKPGSIDFDPDLSNRNKQYAP